MLWMFGYTGTAAHGALNEKPQANSKPLSPKAENPNGCPKAETRVAEFLARQTTLNPKRTKEAPKNTTDL